MSTTSDGVFGTASQSNKGGLYEDWQDLANVKIDSTAETYTGTLSGPENTEDMILSGPASGSEVPAGDNITEIQITIRGKEAGSGVVCSLRGVEIENGSTQGNESLTSSFATYTWSGDLTYWGLTQQEARDFADGSANLTFRGFNQTADATIHIQWVKCQFTHETPASDLVYPAVLF